jgi:hypothetical protein
MNIPKLTTKHTTVGKYTMRAALKFCRTWTWMIRNQWNVLRVHPVNWFRISFRAWQFCATKFDFFSPTDLEDLDGLECSEQAENIINGKIWFFYIEAVPPKKFQLRKKYFFEVKKKIREKSQSQKNWWQKSKISNFKIENFKIENGDFLNLRFSIFSRISPEIFHDLFFVFFPHFFRLFSELRFFGGIASM